MTNRLRRQASTLAINASLFAVALLVASLAPASPVAAQTPKRDHLTPQEVESIRDAQALDARTGVFIKAAERRMQAIFGQLPADVKQSKKEKEADAKMVQEWGDLPTATRAELLYDVAHILDEAIENIDDTAQHNPKSDLLPRAVRKLSDAAQRFTSQLAPLRASVTDKAEREQLEQALDNAQQIIEAAKKLPAEETKEKPGKKG